MRAKTGQTVIENILSLDADNNAISAATFDAISLKNGLEYSGITLTINLVDEFRGIFYASWSADTTGDYQFYIKNNLTNVIFITNPVSVLPDSSFEENIYIGL